MICIKLIIKCNDIFFNKLNIPVHITYFSFLCLKPNCSNPDTYIHKKVPLKCTITEKLYLKKSTINPLTRIVDTQVLPSRVVLSLGS